MGTRLQIITSRQSSQISALNRFLADNHISQDLVMKLQRSAQHAMTEQRKNAPEDSIELLCLMSGPLMQELHFEMYSPLLLVHPLFQVCLQAHRSGIRKVCHSATCGIAFAESDVLF